MGGCGWTQAVGLGGRGGSSKFVIFTTQEDIRWSRSIAPVILSLGTRCNRVVRRFAAGTDRSISCLGGWVGHTDSLDGLLKNISVWKRNRVLDFVTRTVVTTPTELSHDSVFFLLKSFIALNFVVQRYT